MNLIFGVIGISYAFSNNISIAVVCLMVSGVCDMFDGTVAKRFDRSHSEKSYGIQIDTLADIVSFGVLPGVIGLALGLNHFPFVLIVTLYVLAALVRLAYFNVTELEFLNSGGQTRRYYEGLPVTTVAAILPLVYLLSLWIEFPLQVVYGFLLVALTIAFVAKFHIHKLKMRYMILLGIISIPAIILLIMLIIQSI